MPPLVIADAQTRSKSTTRSVSEVSGSLAPKQNAWQVVGVQGEHGCGVGAPGRRGEPHGGR